MNVCKFEHVMETEKPRRSAPPPEPGCPWPGPAPRARPAAAHGRDLESRANIVHSEEETLTTTGRFKDVSEKTAGVIIKTEHMKIEVEIEEENLQIKREPLDVQDNVLDIRESHCAVKEEPCMAMESGNVVNAAVSEHIMERAPEPLEIINIKQEGHTEQEVIDVKTEPLCVDDAFDKQGDVGVKQELIQGGVECVKNDKRTIDKINAVGAINKVPTKQEVIYVKTEPLCVEDAFDKQGDVSVKQELIKVDTIDELNSVGADEHQEAGRVKAEVAELYAGHDVSAGLVLGPAGVQARAAGGDGDDRSMPKECELVSENETDPLAVSPAVVDPRQCPVCKKVFKFPKQVKEHMRVHTGEKIYSCNVCSKLFATSSTLATHKRIHTGERPYTCGTCNKAFTQRSSLEIHKRIHTRVEDEKKRKERNREYVRAFRQRQKALKNNKKDSKEEKEEAKRNDLQKKRRKLDSNEDQKNIVQCRASQNLENVQLEQNEFVTQQLRMYDESRECITPKVILHRHTDITGDGDCLFHSLIRVLRLQISTCDLRRELRDSPYLNSCRNPQEAYIILSSDNEYGDLDCLYLFTKIYHQNICVHFHYFNVISKNEDTRFCHFKVNDTHNWIHLDHRELRFTPYFSDDEKKKEDERKRKQKNKEYSKRYRDKKRALNLRTGPSPTDVSDVLPVICTQKDLKKSKKDSKEDKEEEKRNDLQMKRRKLDSNKDQENVVQCRASQNLENVQLEQYQILAQKQKQKNKEYSKRYRDKKRASNLRTGPSPTDVSDVQPVIHTQKDLKKSKKDSEEEKEEEKINDLQMKRRKLDSNENQENVVQCRASQNFENLQLELNRFLTQKQMQKDYFKRYRDKKRASKLQTGPSPTDVSDVQPVIRTSQIAGHHQAATGGVPFVLPVSCSPEIADLLSTYVPSSLSIQSNYNSIEDRVRQRHSPSQVVESSPPDIHLQTYSAFEQNSSAHRQFEKDFVENEFGHACDICDRLWFKKDLKYLQNNDATPNIEFIRTLLSNTAILKIKICLTCLTAIQKKHIPPLSVYNGFKYPPLPDCLKHFPLDFVTERLISPRIPFMQIRRLRHVHGQHGIYGQVINVPMEVNTMVHQLPRQVDDDHAITVHIKRKINHKSSYVYGIVAKRKIKVWLRYLKDTPLYKSSDVLVDDGFLNDTNDDVEDELIFDEDGDNDILEQIPVEESLMAQQQTLMWNDDIYLRIARGEGAPKSLLFDEHAEELSFPQIYLGQFREFRHAVTPFMMATSELRRSDRRGVTPHHLLYMAMNIMRIRVVENEKDSLNTALKHGGQGVAITKEQIQSDDYIHGCIETNLAFLRSIPNSTYYWAERKRDLFAMIRQYGKPTIFFTISANEIGWPKLLRLLHNLKSNAKISVKEAADLHFIEKSTLVNEDAVTCAIYFNKLVEILLKILQSKRHSPFKKYRILHYFKRIEFQHRGSPDAHVLAWLDNAPEDALDRDYNEAIDLIDFLISVSAAEASGDIRYQTHKHNNFTCYKGKASRQQNCRFDAPFMPVKKTMILTPMPDTENGFQQYKAKYNSIQKNLEKYEYNGFQSFYDENDIASDDEYVKIIRAGINRPRVFPKREPCEKWNNPFNPFILNVVRSNTDFQFIPEEYSCAAYVVEYVNKTNRGVSDLRRQIIEIMDEHPEFNLFDIIKNIGINLLNHTEMTSQEAAWYLLRQPLSKSSTVIVYIPTVWPDKRHRIKKTMKELSELEAGSTDVWKENWFDKYEKRPEDLAGITLAQFVAKYYKNIKGDYVPREEPKVIRYRNYDMGTDYNEYRREMVTLHLPFRHEQSEILAESRYLQLYEENEALILDRRKEFESNVDIGKTLEICKELCREYVSDDGVGEEINDVVGRTPDENPR